MAKDKLVPPRPAATQWEQTLVATPAQQAPPLSVPEPLPELPAPEPTPLEAAPAPLDVLEPLPDLEPAPSILEDELVDAGVSEEYPFDVPQHLAKFVRRDGSELILKEPFLPRETRVALESAFTKNKKVKLEERRWIPSHREPVRDIERAVDAMKWESRYKPKAVAWMDRAASTRRKAMEGLERIPANIVAKRVVYETEGGFVVEVTYRELGQTLKKYFTVPAKGTHTQALNAIRSGSYAKATVVSPDLIDLVPVPRGEAKKALPPGKVRTWPIKSRYAVNLIPGINVTMAKVLNGLGVRTTDQLRLQSPVVVSRHLGIAVPTIRKWQNEAEFLLIPGLGEQYAHVLAEADIQGLGSLQRMTPSRLAQQVNDAIRSKRGKKPRFIRKARGAAWIRKAKKLRKTAQPFPV